ncbi:MAG: hypothetical protein WC707_04380 [Candidatus Babeliaceae bacterium]
MIKNNIVFFVLSSIPFAALCTGAVKRRSISDVGTATQQQLHDDFATKRNSSEIFDASIQDLAYGLRLQRDKKNDEAKQATQKKEEDDNKIKRERKQSIDDLWKSTFARSIDIVKSKRFNKKNSIIEAINALSALEVVLTTALKEVVDDCRVDLTRYMFNGMKENPLFKDIQTDLGGVYSILHPELYDPAEFDPACFIVAAREKLMRDLEDVKKAELAAENTSKKNKFKTISYKPKHKCAPPVLSLSKTL